MHKHDLRRMGVETICYRPLPYMQKLIAVSEQTYEGVLSWYEGCCRVSQVSHIAMHETHAWLTLFCRSERTPEYGVIARAVACHMDGTIPVDYVITAIMVHTGLCPELAASWAQCLIAREQEERNSDDAARRAGKHFCMLCDEHKKESELVHGYLCPTHKHPTQELKG